MPNDNRYKILETKVNFNESIFKAQFFAPRTVFPAPLRWIYFLAKYVYRSKRSAEMGKEDITRRKTKYIYLLRQLVKMAVHQRGDTERDEKMHFKEQIEVEKKEKLRLEERIEEEKGEKIRLREDVERLQTMLNSAQQLINNMQSQKKDGGEMS